MVEDLVKEAIKIWGQGNYLIKAFDDQPHEANLLNLDIAKAKNELGWQPKWNASTAILNTIEWYKSFNNNSNDIINFSLKQIEEYLNL